MRYAQGFGIRTLPSCDPLRENSYCCLSTFMHFLFVSNDDAIGANGYKEIPGIAHVCGNHIPQMRVLFRGKCLGSFEVRLYGA